MSHLQNSNIFIAGGLSFIASAILSRSLSDNKIKVYENFSRDTPSKSGLAVLRHRIPKAFETLGFRARVNLENGMSEQNDA